jgi:phage FluMu protein Com
MPIEFSCPSCRQLVRTADSTAGKKGKCPQCQAVVQIPLRSAAAQAGERARLAPPPAARRSEATPAASPPTPAFIEFFCAECGQLVRTPAAAAGKKGKCPLCRQVVEIPRRAGGRAQEPGGGSQGAGARELEPYLTPLEELTPLHSLTPPTPMLAPLLDEVLPTLAPLPAGALTSLRPINPYDSPFAAGPQPRRLIDDSYRRGLPWELVPSTDSFSQTIQIVLGSSDDAFRAMRRTGGIGNPFGFLMLSQVLTAFLQVVVSFVLSFVYDIVLWAFGGQRLEIQWDAKFLAFGGLACLAITGGLAKGTIGGLITAAMYHVCLLVTGGAAGGFQATYRVVAFGTGSVYMLTAIPLIGPLLALVMHFVVLTAGLKNAHEISGGRAFLALVLPALLGLCCVGGLVLVYAPVFIEALRKAHGH